MLLMPHFSPLSLLIFLSFASIFADAAMPFR